MYLAIKGNQLEAIKFLTSKLFPIHYTDSEKVDNSPLFFAIKSSNLAALELFCDMDTTRLDTLTNSQGANAVLIAALSGNFAAVNYLSVRGVDLNVEDKDGRQLLLLVLLADQQDLATKLLSRGANINYLNKDGLSCLSQCLLLKRIQPAKWLIVSGAEFHLEDKFGRDSCDYYNINELKGIPELKQCDYTKRVKYIDSLRIKTIEVIKEVPVNAAVRDYQS